jgi:Arc/MetJ-type ribon-helix-helix transcriptional regulator
MRKIVHIFRRWLLADVLSGQEVIQQLLRELLQKENTMAGELAALQAQVAANTEVEASAITLIQGLADKLKAAGTDPVALAALTTELETSKEALAAAIVANTPANP